jgi:hypothetical protein
MHIGVTINFREVEASKNLALTRLASPSILDVLWRKLGNFGSFFNRIGVFDSVPEMLGQGLDADRFIPNFC